MASAAGSVDEERILSEEARFADAHYAKFADSLEVNPVMWSKYARPECTWDHRQLAAILLGELAGKRVLDMGCGMGEEAVYLARLGARVSAIDISRRGIELVRRRADYLGLSERIEAHVMRADRSTLPGDSFDVVHGLGILHHLGVDAGLREAHRVLKPGGIGVFYEPVGDSRVLEALKRWIMTRCRFLGFEGVTDHEQNLRFADLEAAGERFAAMHLYPFHLLYRAKRFAPPAIRDTLRKLDAFLLSLAPTLRHAAGAVVIKVRK